MRKPQRGFTLIELMIALAIMAILAAIALPGYNAYIQRVNRGHAKAALLRGAQWMERVATAQGRYPATLAAGLEAVEGNRYTVCLVGAMLATGVALPAPGCPGPGTLTQTGAPLAAASVTEFALVAYRNAPGGNANDTCGDFTLTHTGVRGLVNGAVSVTPATALADCWGK